MPLYLCAIVGSGTTEDPWRGEGVPAQPPRPFTRAIDLRPVGYQRLLVRTRGTVLTGPDKIADTLDEALRPAVRNAIFNRIGVVVPAGTTAAQFIRQVVLPMVRPDRDGKRRIYLDGLVSED